MKQLALQVDELEALQAILCGDGELRVRTPHRLAAMRQLVAACSESSATQWSCGGRDAEVGSSLDAEIGGDLVLEINIHADFDSTSDVADGVRTHSAGTAMQMVMSLPQSYPAQAAAVSVSASRLSRQACERLKSALAAHLQQMLGQCMILEAVQYVKEHAVEYSDRCGAGPTAAAPAETPRRLHYCLLRVDHMHARAAYCRTLRGWCGALGITGGVLFAGRLILVLLESDSPESLCTYLRWHRTRPVDVDTAGRTCKEHCLKTLMPPTELPHAALGPGGNLPRRFNAFTVTDLASRARLEELLAEQQLTQLVPLIP